MSLICHEIHIMSSQLPEGYWKLIN
jgi:hypothetical protein